MRLEETRKSFLSICGALYISISSTAEEISRTDIMFVVKIKGPGYVNVRYRKKNHAFTPSMNDAPGARFFKFHSTHNWKYAIAFEKMNLRYSHPRIPPQVFPFAECTP
jgi:hypothetical protein